MARAALGWTCADLGKDAGVAATTVSRFERLYVAIQRDTAQKLISTFENCGIVFRKDEDGFSVSYPQRFDIYDTEELKEKRAREANWRKSKIPPASSAPNLIARVAGSAMRKFMVASAPERRKA
jgi:transcriptional regulator with XRE-family HTH domain